MKFSPTRRADPAIDLTPMIDVVFQLLLFFMVTTTFISRKDGGAVDENASTGRAPGIEVNLPEAASDKLMGEAKDLNIWITDDGELYLGTEALSLDGIVARLKEAAGRDKNTLVVIKADQGVSHGRVVQIMDVARRQGLLRIGISTSVDPVGKNSSRDPD